MIHIDVEIYEGKAIYLYATAGAHLITRIPPWELSFKGPPDDLRYAWKTDKGWTIDNKSFHEHWMEAK